MKREPAPIRLPDEAAGRFARRVHAYLSQPHRRRLGRRTEQDLLAAIQELEAGK